MNAGELFKSGKLQDAIDAQVKEVRAHPADPSIRLFLFELLAFAGEVERARKQIDAVNYNDPALDMAVLAYRKCLDAEEVRRKLFRDGVAPQFLAPPPDHARWRIEAVQRLREKRWAEASELIQKADAAAPPLQGELNGRPFQGLRDCDDLFGPVLEVFGPGGTYFWTPLEQVELLELDAPKFPRDLIWAHGQLTIRNGPSGNVFLPALYPGTHECTDDQLRLGRATDWKSSESGPVLGLGVRHYLVGEEDTSLLEWRKLTVGAKA